MGHRVPLSLPINRSEICGEIRKKVEGEAGKKPGKNKTSDHPLISNQ
jgi:hypothetical protein